MNTPSRNILILLGSAREDGNSTRLAFAFADAACARGHQVQSIRVPALDLAPCDGCDECWTPATTPCVHRDDMDSVYPVVRKADVIAFATPLHFYTWSAPLKTLIDRFYCLAPGRKHGLRHLQTLLLATAADRSLGAFDGLQATYRRVARFMQWKSIGEVLVPGIPAEGNISRRPRALALAATLAGKIR